MVSIAEIFRNIYQGIVAPLVPLAFGASLVFFLWGIAKYIYNLGNEAKIEEGRNIMIWGAVGLFLASSFLGINYFMQRVLAIDTQNAPMEPPVVSLP